MKISQKTRIRWWVLLGVIAGLLGQSSALATYALVWSDEFEGSTLNLNDWNIDIGNGCPDLCGWGNNELEYYRAENVTVGGGNLVLTARAQNYAGYSFTSGKIHTRNKQSFLYGRFEMRAKLPTGGGTWPAFWMMPQDDVYGGWAASGEIDIMEAANATTEVSGTLHFGGSWPDNTFSGSSYSLGGASFADDFHIYAVEWEPDVIRWYVDDVLFSTRYSNQWYTNAAPGNPRAPFDQEFYLILNSAIGGNYTGCISPGCVTADLPQEFIIDYVRVYADIANSAPTVALTSPTGDDNPPAGDIILTATAADSDGQIAVVEFYEGSTLIGQDSTEPYSVVWTGVADGCYQITARAGDNQGSYATDTVDVTVGSGCGQAPYQGAPFTLPATIQAEDFDTGGQGVAYHDLDSGNNGSAYRPDEGVDIEACLDTGGGYNVGWTGAGEWIEYTLDVPVAGQYTVACRVSSLTGGGRFHLEFSGVDLTGAVDVPATGGWQSWTTVSRSVMLGGGQQVLRFVVEADGFNVNSFNLTLDYPTDVPEMETGGFALHPCFPNPFNPMTTIGYELRVPAPVTLAVYDLSGKVVKTLVSDRVTAPGKHEVVWNGRDEAGRISAAGVYFYRLDAGEFSETRRMTLVK